MSTFKVMPQAERPTQQVGPSPLKKVLEVAPSEQSSISEPSTPEVSEVLKPKEEEPTRLSILAKKESALRRQAQELKREKEALKAKELEYQSSYVPKQSLAERFKTDPLGLMTEHGVSYEQLTQAILNQPSPQNPEMLKIQQELKELKDTQTKAVEQQELRQKQAYEQAVNQIRNEAKLLVDSDPEYETIKETNSQDSVVELIKETFDKTGEILTVEAAAKEVEAYLVEEALKMAQLKKVKARLTPAEVIAEQKSEVPLTSKTNSTIKTLTHAQAGGAKKLTAYERAVLAFEGKLPS